MVQDIASNHTVLALILGVSAVAMIIGALINALLINPLRVGCYNFFNKNTEEKAPLGAMGSGFTKNYKNSVKTMFLKDIYIILWTCVLIIPGIIKMYSYRMVPFILSENPDMPSSEVFAKSKEMMDGNKWHTFLLDLSFIGWYFLTACTAGIAGVFWTQPYVQQTNAELYQFLKNIA